MQWVCLYARAVLIIVVVGFTQYTDLLYPINTQCIITNGQEWLFMAYQLNTINLAHDWTELDIKKSLSINGQANIQHNNRGIANICWHSGLF
jgi:hypothetical protein